MEESQNQPLSFEVWMCYKKNSQNKMMLGKVDMTQNEH
jgi:hypothetical protein